MSGSSLFTYSKILKRLLFDLKLLFFNKIIKYFNYYFNIKETIRTLQCIYIRKLFLTSYIQKTLLIFNEETHTCFVNVINKIEIDSKLFLKVYQIGVF